ncbi:hypothetical protein HK097_000862 [Rhizophlyctis rosea]|uniref:Uncharacterized protein n=1 Tax=Rhizophlyctis rosea TaxID=64517 RepID=A0AAD5S512_9FUNG|nr:hypothetical protein HK097_000862 [Rhizophlyctis rosea]
MHRPLDPPAAEAAAMEIAPQYPIIDNDLAEVLASPVATSENSNSSSDEMVDVGSSYEELVRANDEYSKLFNKFTCYAPPTNTIPDLSAFSLSPPSQSSSSFTVNPETNPVLFNLFNQIQETGLPSTLIPPPHMPPSTPLDYESQILDDFFNSQTEEIGDQPSKSLLEIDGTVVRAEMFLLTRRALSRRRLEQKKRQRDLNNPFKRVRRYRHSIMIIRRKKMRKHKHKKRIKKFRYSNKNKERRKRSGAQRKKQE